MTVGRGGIANAISDFGASIVPAPIARDGAIGGATCSAPT
jgi:hypothetical protein